MNTLNKEELNKNIVNDFNLIQKTKVKNIQDVLDILSERFREIYDNKDDAQEAYNELTLEYPELMNKYCFAYTLSEGNGWSVSTGSDYNEEDLDKYLKVINEHYYHFSHDCLDDILSSIENDICNTMSNVGCDMFTALNLILEEDLYEFEDKNIFVIAGADCEPKIDILY
ncbi:MAG: hypothetical protein IJ086_09925 [Clostridium sp.]|nr:hypothetical protein [Clostridium sp.]